MIKSSKAIVSNKCEVTFDFTPQDVKYSRSNYTATHKGGGTTSRLGIWEGIECVSAEVKIGDGAWKTYSLPANKKVVVSVASNNVTVQARGKYRLKTMGYYFKDTTGKMPFFWYGNVGGVAYKYQKGSFRDAMSNKPDSNFYTVNACVPADWTYIKAEWSDWAYKHAGTTSDWQVDNGRYAQRNGNTTTASYSNGWISDSGHKQIYRKSSLFWFEKTYTNSITTSGIAVNPGIPRVVTIAEKGDSGFVELYYQANNSGNGYITVEAKCRDKIVTIMNYNNSPEFGHEWKKTLKPDFNSIFGESYRANDVYYRAKAKNKAGYESAWSAWSGVNRYNGIPSVPTNLKVDGTNGLIYNNAIISWNKSTDPDGDAVVYDIWLRAESSSGQTLKDSVIVNKHNSLSYNLNISNYEDGTRFTVRVRANDNLKTSDWSKALYFKKGEKPVKVPALLCPVFTDTDIYAKRQRFGFTHDSNSDCVVIFNGIRYDSIKNPELFTIGNGAFIFKPDFDLTNNSKINISAYFTNEYGNSESSDTYNFTKKDIKDNFVQGEIIKAELINQVENVVIPLCKAYKIESNITLSSKNNYYTAQQYNNCYNKVLEINDYINRLVDTDKFDYVLTTTSAVKDEVNNVKLWKQLIHDIVSM